MSNPPFLIAGLGNPGKKYANNRHNVGFMVADKLAERHNSPFARVKRLRAEAAEARLGIGGPRLLIVKPLTFMNLSGEAIGPLAKYFSIPPESILVIHDELDIEYGRLRIKSGGGEGGHNGLKSISKVLGTKDYTRLRCGIGRPPGRMDVVDYVLKDFASAERSELDLNLELAADATETVVEKGVEAAQNQFH
ncbi:aminoacyl-tRNA hydrolase [Haloglycomyces albus]|uniref:aminoacyl-tRNA hydrolase n=1 Tax=Haloglycomyces albus TaxID=526067 RepID=UPI00046C8EB8|nr:aminoacyl-tRNA hydrolase [Haloglycomyces albus]